MLHFLTSDDVGRCLGMVNTYSPSILFPSLFHPQCFESVQARDCWLLQLPSLQFMCREQTFYSAQPLRAAYTLSTALGGGDGGGGERRGRTATCYGESFCNATSRTRTSPSACAAARALSYAQLTSCLRPVCLGRPLCLLRSPLPCLSDLTPCLALLPLCFGTLASSCPSNYVT